MKRFAFLLGSLLTLASQTMLAQMDASIKLNEVMTQNESSLIDEYGARNAWVEIANISHSTYNIRGMYITTDRRFPMATSVPTSRDVSSLYFSWAVSLPKALCISQLRSTPQNQLGLRSTTVMPHN